MNPSLIIPTDSTATHDISVWTNKYAIGIKYGTVRMICCPPTCHELAMKSCDASIASKVGIASHHALIHFSSFFHDYIILVYIM